MRSYLQIVLFEPLVKVVACLGEYFGAVDYVNALRRVLRIELLRHLSEAAKLLAAIEAGRHMEEIREFLEARSGSAILAAMIANDARILSTACGLEKNIWW
jgi:hypothetical protein